MAATAALTLPAVLNGPRLKRTVPPPPAVPSARCIKGAVDARADLDAEVKVQRGGALLGRIPLERNAHHADSPGRIPRPVEANAGNRRQTVHEPAGDLDLLGAERLQAAILKVSHAGAARKGRPHCGSPARTCRGATAAGGLHRCGCPCRPGGSSPGGPPGPGENRGPRCPKVPTAPYDRARPTDRCPSPARRSADARATVPR